jgi:hypothetical protein
MKCRYSAFNAQGSRLIIAVVQLGAVKIYVAGVEALRKKERRITLMYLTFVFNQASWVVLSFSMKEEKN